MANGSPARIMGATTDHGGGLTKSDVRTMPLPSIIQQRSKQEAVEAMVVARALPKTPKPRTDCN